MGEKIIEIGDIGSDEGYEWLQDDAFGELVGDGLSSYRSEKMGKKIIERDAKSILFSDPIDLLPEAPFIESLSRLRVVDLSHTSIKTLTPSISRLISLEKLILRCCNLLMELPPEIGELKCLEVLDLDGTELIYLPREIGNLRRLKELRLSIYGHGESVRNEKGIKRIYPQGTFSSLGLLKVLSIDVDPDEEQWIDEVESVISDLTSMIRSYKLYLPKVKLLGLFPRYILALIHFHFVVGNYEQRLISRIPQEVEENFKANSRSLKYINGDTISTELVRVLRFARAFFLDRHWTIKNLTEIGSANLTCLKCALFLECNELETILDEDELQLDIRLGVLQYLGLFYLKSLTSICRGKVGRYTLSDLKHLILRTCTSLTQIFTFELLKNLRLLKELVVEDCPNVKSLVTEVSLSSNLGHFLPRLKKMSLLWLPELVSISNNISIAPELERLVVFHCRKLKRISTKELTLQNLNVLKAEREWWDSVGRNHKRLASIFVEIKMDGKLNSQLTEDDS